MATNPPDQDIGKKPVYISKSISIWFSLIMLGLALLLDYFLWGALGLDPLIAWLLAINLIEFLSYVLDSLYQQADYPRLPESVFMVQAIVGGTIGALLGIVIFNHAKSRGLLKHYLAVIIFTQVALISLYLIIF